MFAFLPIYKHKLNFKPYRTRTYFFLKQTQNRNTISPKSTSASIFWGNYFAFCDVPLLSKFDLGLAQGSEFVFCLVFDIHDQSLDSLLHQVIFDFWYIWIELVTLFILERRVLINKLGKLVIAIEDSRQNTLFQKDQQECPF